MSEIIGGWSKFSCNISDEARKAFGEALHDILGVAYEIVAVADQPVDGMNFTYFCNAQVVGPDEANYAAMVFVYVDLKGNYTLKGIERCREYPYGEE